MIADLPSTEASASALLKELGEDGKRGRFVGVDVSVYNPFPPLPPHAMLPRRSS